MANNALYVLAGYDDVTEARLAALQNKLYEQGFTGTHTKNIPQRLFPLRSRSIMSAFLPGDMFCS